MSEWANSQPCTYTTNTLMKLFRFEVLFLFESVKNYLYIMPDDQEHIDYILGREKGVNNLVTHTLLNVYTTHFNHQPPRLLIYILYHKKCGVSLLKEMWWLIIGPRHQRSQVRIRQCSQ